jgi:hypothetical protein
MNTTELQVVKHWNNRSFKKEFHLWKQNICWKSQLIYALADVLEANKEEYAQHDPRNG